MHNANQSIYQIIISRLEECYVPLTSEDKSKIQAYLNGIEDDKTINTIKGHMTVWNYDRIPGMYAFLYKKQGIYPLLEIISDENKFKEDVTDKISKYRYSYRSGAEYISKNFREFVAYNTFMNSPSDYIVSNGGQVYSNYEVYYKNWCLAYNNLLIVKKLAEGKYGHHGCVFYDKDGYDQPDTAFGFNLAHIKEKVDCYIKKVYGKLPNNVIVINLNHEKEDKKINEQGPYSLLECAKVGVVKAALCRP